MDRGPSCEYHAISRFASSFVWAISSYLPLNLLVLLITKTPSLKNLRHALRTAILSSSFLASFVSLFFYGICLTRTRLGPPLLRKLLRLSSYSSSYPANSTASISPQQNTTSPSTKSNTNTNTIPPSLLTKIDSGLCILTGCLLCGWSVFLESPHRRKELALFVAPRALATLLPRRYELRKQWMENLAFAGSVAVVFTAVQEGGGIVGKGSERERERVRGVLGRLLRRVLVVE